MNKSPLNYLITIALGILFLVVTAIFYGGKFSESLILAKATPEDFLAQMRMILGAAAFLGIFNCVYWYYYGNKDSVAGNLHKAKRVWVLSLILQIIFSVVLLVVLVMMNLSEGVQTSSWLILFCLLSVHTWIFFWFCTFLMSPRTVQYIPLFK